jgi:hypothetical protein
MNVTISSSYRSSRIHLPSLQHSLHNHDTLPSLIPRITFKIHLWLDIRSSLSRSITFLPSFDSSNTFSSPSTAVLKYSHHTSRCRLLASLYSYFIAPDYSNGYLIKTRRRLSKQETSTIAIPTTPCEGYSSSHACSNRQLTSHAENTRCNKQIRSQAQSSCVEHTPALTPPI